MILTLYYSNSKYEIYNMYDTYLNYIGKVLKDRPKLPKNECE